jgi:hypothetical protein
VAKVKNETKVRQAFLANWEEARVEQVNVALQLEEKKWSEDFDKIEEETSNEFRVHSELSTALEKAIDVFVPHSGLDEIISLIILEDQYSERRVE